jgi:flagellar hook-associated protein 1 FlgK
MLGLFGTLDLASRSLQTQQQGMSVASHNLANATNPTYSRQRVVIQTSVTIPTPFGVEGTGANVVRIEQIRSALLDSQIQNEAGVTGYWLAQQTAYESAQSALGEQVNRTGDATVVGEVNGLADSISDLFNSFQALTTDPSSLSQRQTVLDTAQQLALRFNQATQRLDNLRTGLNASLTADAAKANELLGDIAALNDQISLAELMSGGGPANDLRDLRQQKIEELSQLVRVDTAEQPNGAVNVSIDGALLVSNNQVLDTLATYDAGGGQLLIQTATGGTPLTPTSGSIAGTIDARDNVLATLSNDLDTLAAQLISEVNAIHQNGFSLTGSTGAAFFTGANAHDIGVNAALVNDPRLLQISDTAGEAGNNTMALQLAQLASQPQAALGNQTFRERYSQIVTGLGQTLASVNGQIADQEIVAGMLEQQRQSVSGVSVDEEMANLVKFQRAFQASARVVTTVDEMLETIINMKR